MSEEDRADLFMADYGERAANLEHEDEVSRKLSTDFRRALRHSEQYAIDAVERAAQNCMKTVDLYLECEMHDFEGAHSRLQKEMYLQLYEFKHKANQLYWKQLVVLDHYIMNVLKEDGESIRRIFTLSCYLPICAKVRQMKLRFASIVETAIEYRQDEIRDIMINFKRIEKEVSEGKVKYDSESDMPFDEYSLHGVQICVWEDKIQTNSEEDTAVTKKISEFFDNELARSQVLWDVVTQVSVEYCKTAIDCALEADIPMFDLFIERACHVVDAALRTSVKVMRAIINRFGISCNSEVKRMTAEYFSNNVEHLLQENAAYFRGELMPLHRYRIEERKEASEKYRERLKAADEHLVKNFLLHDENGEITPMRDLDLSEYELTTVGAGGQFPCKQFYSEQDQIEIRNFCGIFGHPNILRMICRGHREEERYLVLEYCPSSLADELKTSRESEQTSPLDKKEFVAWIRQLADGMHYLHRHATQNGPQLYHGDLKPENILIAEDRTIRIADFGVSLFLASAVELDGRKSLRGTPNYMAPELHRGEIDRKLLQKADLWSFGVVVWEMMANRRPHEKLSDVQLMMEIGKNSLHPPLPSGTIESLENLLRQCWQAVPEYRPTFKEIRRKIEDVAEEIGDLDEEDWVETCATWKSAKNEK